MADLYTKPQAKSGSIRRGLSPTMWHQAPLTQILSGDLGEGFAIIDDFLTFNDESPWIVTNATAGTAALDDAKGGVVLLDSASGTNNQGVQMQLGGATGSESFLPSAAAKIYVEARIKVADIGTSGSDTCNLLFGLTEVSTAVLSSGANDTANHIVFEHLDDDGNLDFFAESGGTRGSAIVADTLSDGTYFKLGFIVDGTSSVTPYINGVAGTAITSNIPTTELTLSLVCHSAGTTDPILHVDWVAACQAEHIAN